MKTIVIKGLKYRMNNKLKPGTYGVVFTNRSYVGENGGKVATQAIALLLPGT